MSRKSHRGRDQEPSGVDASVYFGDEVGRRADRKERQLCRQVQEAIGEALSSLEDEVLLEVYVCSVEPAPDATRLAILVQASKGSDLDAVKERLSRVSGYLRAEVAQAITRKRVPILTFQVLPPEALS
jgi:ribosome-binding factor A